MLYSEHCEIVKGDNRRIPGPMNDIPGTAINIFPELKTTIPGRIVNVSYYAVRTGTVFVSFWKETGVYGQFELVAKVFINVIATYMVAVSKTVIVFKACIIVFSQWTIIYNPSKLTIFRDISLPFKNVIW